MSGLRSQQYRWIKGGVQNARLHLGASQHAAVSRPGFAGHARRHLLAGSTYLVIMVRDPPVRAAERRVGTSQSATTMPTIGIPFGLATLALFAVFHAARRPQGVSRPSALRHADAVFLVFTIGLAGAQRARGVGRAGPAGRGVRPDPEVRQHHHCWRLANRQRYTPHRLDPRIVPEVLVYAVLLGRVALAGPRTVRADAGAGCWGASGWAGSCRTLALASLAAPSGRHVLRLGPGGRRDPSYCRTPRFTVPEGPYHDHRPDGAMLTTRSSSSAGSTTRFPTCTNGGGTASSGSGSTTATRKASAIARRRVRRCSTRGLRGRPTTAALRSATGGTTSAVDWGPRPPG